MVAAVAAAIVALAQTSVVMMSVFPHAMLSPNVAVRFPAFSLIVTVADADIPRSICRSGQYHLSLERLLFPIRV